MAETKVSLLLLPKEINRSNNIIASLHVTKNGKNIQLQDNLLTRKELRQHFVSLKDPVKEAISLFCDEDLENAYNRHRQKLNVVKAGVDSSKHLHNAMARHLHRSLEQLKPFASQLKWHHKIPNKKNFLIAPCQFSNYKPQLEFRVQKNRKDLELVTIINVNGYSSLLSSFERDGFLLQSRNEYFLLSFADFQTLEWLSSLNIKPLARDPHLFSQKILVRLEGNYPVDRNNLFVKKEIRTAPANRVMLSELSNTFLMLTPQWVYDGFVVDGPWKETYETATGGEEIIIYRQREQEEALSQLLLSLHPSFTAQRNGYFYLVFAEAQKKQWFLKVYHKLLDDGIELTGMDMLQHFRYSPHKAETVSAITKEENNQVKIELNVQFGPETVPLQSLQKMLLAGQKAVVLKDSSLGVLSDEWMQQYATIIKHGKVNKNTVEVTKYLAISEHRSPEKRGVMGTLVKEQWWNKWQQWHNGGDSLYPLPVGVQATLRPYQQKGYEWLSLLAEAGAGACLADDMGLGKTLQTICFLARHIEQHPGSVNIIVCPSSLIYNWQQELQKFTPGISSVVFHGAGRSSTVLEEDCQVVITSYGTLRADAALLLAKEYSVAVIDESHNIKNPSAQITTVTSMLQARVRIALSGTPVVNNTFDLYSQLNFALPGMFGSREFFKREYADAIDRNHDEEKIKALQKLTAPFILRRTKEQVAKDLPEKNEMILWCSMGMQQQDLYNEIRDQVSHSIFLDIKHNGLGKSKLGVLAAMMKLRQVCNSPMLLPAGERQGCIQSVKTDMIVRELKNIGAGHKALVFSQFSSMLHLLAEALDNQGISYYHFDGSTPAPKRSEMVNAFQDENDATPVFLISLKAGNTGLTLTAADYVFLFDPWWNTAVEQQAIDRTHRIGQTKNVFAYKMICKHTIEEKIIILQNRKKKLAEDLVGDDTGFIKELSEEDIAFLFG